MTNDAWFGDTTEPWIHLALAKLRAVEHRRYLVRAPTAASGRSSTRWAALRCTAAIFREEASSARRTSCAARRSTRSRRRALVPRLRRDLRDGLLQAQAAGCGYPRLRRPGGPQLFSHHALTYVPLLLSLTRARVGARLLRLPRWATTPPKHGAAHAEPHRAHRPHRHPHPPAARRPLRLGQARAGEPACFRRGISMRGGMMLTAAAGPISNLISR